MKGGTAPTFGPTMLSRSEMNRTLLSPDAKSFHVFVSDYMVYEDNEVDAQAAVNCNIENGCWILAREFTSLKGVP